MLATFDSNLFTLIAIFGHEKIEEIFLLRLKDITFLRTRY